MWHTIIGRLLVLLLLLLVGCFFNNRANRLWPSTFIVS